MKRDKFLAFVAFSASGIGAAAFSCVIWNWFFFNRYGAREPNHRSGSIYPFNIKGHVVYISAEQVTYHAICGMLSVAGGLLFAVFVAYKAHTLQGMADAALTRLTVISFLTTAGLLVLFGHKFADLLVTNRIVLTF